MRAACGQTDLMARILLGVSGGIAAYKAVELVRLATGAGHSVRVIQTPTSLRFVGKATFEGVTGAPVLVDEFEPDPARGAFPGEPGAGPRRRSPTSSWSAAATCSASRPASANTIAKLAGGLADNLLTSAALASPGAAGARPGDERPDVRAPGHPGEPRAPARARRADRAPGHGPAGLEGGVGHRTAGRPRRHPRGDRGQRSSPPRSRRARSTGCGCSSRPAARASRSTRCATWATARRVAWAWRWPRRPPGAEPRSR